jgi:hypothetical protein
MRPKTVNFSPLNLNIKNIMCARYPNFRGEKVERLTKEQDKEFSSRELFLHNKEF